MALEEHQNLNKSVSEQQTKYQIILKQLTDLSIHSLPEMFDEQTKLFCHMMKQNDQGKLKEGLSRRYTLIALLGLFKYQLINNHSPIDIKETISELCCNINRIKSIGDLGLLLWLVALAAPEKSQRLYSDLDINKLSSRYPDFTLKYTMELSWFLTGLCYTALNLNQIPSGLTDLIKNTYKLLKDNYRDNGIFDHSGNVGFKSKVRRHIGTFADQVYPIYAFCIFSKVIESEEALQIALKCAKKICALQGSLGQWWWHYHSVRGEVVRHYNVYSVHQDSMAPMALMAIQEATGIDFKKFIHKGVMWVSGKNEINYNMIDTKSNLIWRCLYEKKNMMYVEEIFSLLRISKQINKHKNLFIKYECRPYHLGWILYTFSKNNLNFPEA